jgi:two-component system chemotaxis response regulator CheB
MTPPPSYDLVVVAASAGGIHALSVVVGALPEDFPAAVVVVQHLDPRHRSLIDDILSRRTKLSVRQVSTGDRVEPGTVFVAPPDHHVLVSADGSFTLSKAELVHFVRPSADLLFESAAGSYGDRVIGVVLTGTGSDGSMGVEAVKKAGGTVIAESRESAQFFGMPEAAIRTGSVDFELSLDEIGPALVTLVNEARS